jgi:hypothetical protein
MSCVNPNSIIYFFNTLNASGFQYILIRNINNELPGNLAVGKDIDLLVHYHQRTEFIGFLIENGFKNIRHPLFNDIFLYGVNKFEFFVNNDNILLDLNYQLACRSLNDGEWIPLAGKIQDNAWKNKIKYKTDQITYNSLSAEDEFIVLVARSIFDKKEFQKGYVERIDALMHLIDLDDVVDQLQLVFFKFTPMLLSMLKKREYDLILDRYISFSEY